MNWRRKTGVVLFATALCVFTNALTASDSVDNPRYIVWSQFKEGSTSTVSADVRQADKNTRIDVTKTLTANSSDRVIVDTVVATNGKPAPATTETILAITTKDDVKITGNRPILAMGKTFACKVWDVTVQDPKQTPPGDVSVAKAPRAIICVNSDVPGGVVQLESLSPDGKKLVFVLTAMQAK